MVRGCKACPDERSDIGNPAIGRWFVVNPHADSYQNASPNCCVGNNPIRRIDPDGRDWYESESGAILWQKGDAKNIEINGEKFIPTHKLLRI